MTALLIVVATGELGIVDRPAERIDADHFRGARLVVPVSVAAALSPEMVVGPRIYTKRYLARSRRAATRKGGHLQRWHITVKS